MDNLSGDNMELLLKESGKINRQELKRKTKVFLWCIGFIVVGYLFFYSLYFFDFLGKRGFKAYHVVAVLIGGVLCIGVAVAFVTHFIKGKKLSTYKISVIGSRLIYLKNEKQILDMPLDDVIEACFRQVHHSISSGKTRISHIYMALSIYYRKNGKVRVENINTTFLENKSDIKNFISFINNLKK